MVLNQPPSRIVRSILGYNEIVSVPSEAQDWPCFVSLLPDGQGVKDNALTVVDRQAVRQGRLMKSPREVIERHAVQIMLRSMSYKTGWQKMADVAANIDSILKLGIDVGNYLYYIPNVRRMPVISVGQETDTAKRRFLFSLNLDFVASQEGPYPEWGNEENELYSAMYDLNQLIHVNFPLYFGAE